MKAARFAPAALPTSVAADAHEAFRAFEKLESLRAYEMQYGDEFDAIVSMSELNAARCKALDAAHCAAVEDPFDEAGHFAFEAECAIDTLRAACASSKTVARIENARAAVYVAHTILARIDDAAYAAYTVGVSVPENLQRAILRAKRRLLRALRAAHNTLPGRISARDAVTRF